MLCALVLALPARAADRDPEAPATAAKDGPSYVRFEPMFVPIIKGSRVTQQVGITLMLLLTKGEHTADVEAKRPQLTDAFFRELYGFFQARSALHGPINEAYLKSRLLRVASRIVGPHAIQAILIEQLFARPI